MKASIYKNAYDSVGAVVNVSTVLTWIKNGKYMDTVLRIRDTEDEELQDELKKSLPAVTFSGHFSPTRSLVNCVEYNKVLVFDIDKLSAERVAELSKAFTKDPHILASWISPREAGIKGLVPVTSDKDHHYDAFECVSMYFKTHYNVELDGSGKDICRLCFMSYDPDLHYNASAISMQIELRAEDRAAVYSDKFLSRKGLGVTVDDRAKYELAKKWAEYHEPYTEGARNQHIFICTCSMNRLGIEVERAAILLVGDRTDMPAKEIIELVKKTYKRNTSEFGTQTMVEYEAAQEASKDSLPIKNVMDSFESLMSITASSGITLGSHELDSNISTMPGEICGFIGPEKSYKSVHAMLVARLNATAGVPVVYGNGEMSEFQWTQYLVLQHASLDISKKAVREEHADIIRSAISDMSLIGAVHAADFNEENLLATIDAHRVACGRDVGLLIVDGINHMEQSKGDGILSTIHNSKVIKQVAKKANQGRGIFVIVLMHTDKDCMPWYRQPQNFILGKTQVRRNLDSSLGFSRFVDPKTSFLDGTMNEYDLRMDAFNIKAFGYRGGGETVNQVFSMNRCMQAAPTDLLAAQFEVEPPKKERGYQ